MRYLLKTVICLTCLKIRQVFITGQSCDWLCVCIILYYSICILPQQTTLTLNIHWRLISVFPNCWAALLRKRKPLTGWLPCNKLHSKLLYHSWTGGDTFSCTPDRLSDLIFPIPVHTAEPGEHFQMNLLENSTNSKFTKQICALDLRRSYFWY